MIWQKPDPPPPSVATTIIVAMLTTFATGLATWAVDELRAKYRSTTPTEKDGKAP